MLPKKLNKKLEDRKANNAFRELGSNSKLVDFSSNDYLEFSKSETIFDAAHQYLVDNNLKQNGATGSRLLSGNHKLYNEVESEISKIHNCEAALIFNSGYDANIGLLSSVPQRGDIILYDELCHASIRDGINMSNAKSYKFKHNDLEDLAEMLKRVQHDKSDTYIITESVFSMDGDSPDLEKLIKLTKTQNAHLIIDEAHALGVFEKGLVQKLGLENDVFARVITFGKALGCHGAAILGSQDLKDYLVNFSRSFIYTTALPPQALANIKIAYNELTTTNEIYQLKENISFFKKEVKRIGFQKRFLDSDSAIQCCILPGNEKVKSVASILQDHGYDVKPILSPTIPKGKERLRFCIHSYNSKEEISEVLTLLVTFANQ
ncbi:aminotransferase class I/II-fold pyridoxal phosphate-dependent enzyme [Winogradskyella ouciana]|uniref:Aminotransferase class I/II-fold pyridoxal phosphate-dependent enzyme n=1 Tax=Winogradskyella ouciana TaxID=2608631 RepID=A0A7K1GA64_9FLAO|nr:pyridoxal phosphate-dependent aminotransferase family protein [Winogradskyella ouciana]MTE26206.1 aminotransferase class I/II-fold pyridoxal phosphate-dependent enzyme [Winogradskyella ouciana]